MLANQMPMIPYTVHADGLQRFEALAFSCLASYNDQAIQPRVLLSFQRAFDNDAMYLAPRVPNGRPGYAIGSWQGKPQEKLIVAFEGATSFAQLYALWQLSTNVHISGLQGFVWRKFNDHATTIITELLGNGNFTWALSKTGVPITFTGFSMGAAVAEIVANRLRLAYERKAMKVIRLASPRVGTSRWVAGRSRTIIHNALYYDRDPIDLFPFSATPAVALNTPTSDATPTSWAASGEGQRFGASPYITPPNTIHVSSYQLQLQAARDLRRTMDRANQWSDHNQWYYFLMFLRHYAPYNRNIMARCKFLEFNDRNKFGELYEGGPGITTAMEELHSPDPAPVEVEFTREETRAMLQALINAGVDPEELPLPDTDEGGSPGGGDDDVVPSVIPSVRQIRPQAPPTFQPVPTGRRRRF